MGVKETVNISEISSFLNKMAFGQNDYEQKLNKKDRKKMEFF